MFTRLTAVISLLMATASATSCTSLASLVKGNSGNPPAGLGVPDCAYITQHASTICYGLGAWDIVNSDTCYLKASGYGCLVYNGLFNTQDTFYCQLGVASQPTETPTASPSASSSASSSASPSLSPSSSPSESPSESPSASPSASASANPSASPSASQSPLASPTSLMSATPTHTSTRSPSASAYPTSTSTLTGSSSPSMNVTLVYVTAPIGDGEKAAIGLSAIFGFCILFLCCGTGVFILRRKAPSPALSTSLPPSRRTSMVNEPQESKTPKLSIRRNSIIEKTVSKKVVVRTVN